MSIKLFSTAPTEGDVFWQVVLFPTITVLRNREFGGAYYAVSVEWLFWSVTTILNDN
jgi:hypothetical protein